MTQLFQFSDANFRTGCDLAVRSLVVLLVAALVVRYMRRSSAAARHLVWSSALIGLLLMPVIYVAIPLRLDLTAWYPRQVPSQSADPVTPMPDSSTPLLVASALSEAGWSGDAQSAHRPVTNQRHQMSLATDVYVDVEHVFAQSISWRTALFGVWLTGACVLLFPICLSLYSLRCLRLGARPMTCELAHELLQLARTLGLRRVPMGLQSDARRMPMTWGIRRTIVLLPTEASQWSPERQRMVLLHELAHIRRGDCLFQLIGQIVRACYWFNPLAWWALTQLRLEQEQACDDCVLNQNVAGDEYAAELLSVTAGLPSSIWDSAVALAMGRASRLEQRLAAILDQQRNRRSPTSRKFAVCLTMFGLALIGVSTLRHQTAFATPPETAKAQSSEKPQLTPGRDIVPVPKSPDNQTPVKPAPLGPKADAPKPALPQTKVNAASVDRALRTIERAAVTAIDQNALNEAAIRGMVQSLKDPYSTLVTTEELKDLYQQIDGRIVGIGAALSREENRTIVRNVLPNSPALKGGLQRLDEILSVDGQPIAANLAEAVKVIRGMSGTEVTLKIRRTGQEMSLTLTRGDIRLPAVRGLTIDAQGQSRYWMDQTQGIAYLQISEFSKQSPEDVKSILNSLQQAGLKALVLDVRACPGGILTACVDVLRLFLNNAKVIETRGRTPEQNSTFSTGPQVVYPDLPLVVLIDRQTASAAEVMSVALRDNGRAIIVGERSFGKGSVQSILPLEQDGPALKLTTAEMISPSGRSLSRRPDSNEWGVDPTDGYYIPLTPEQRAGRGSKIEGRETGTLKLPDVLTPELIEQDLSDPALAAALKTLQSKVSTGEFTKVGRPLNELNTQLAQKLDLLKQREEIRRKLEQLDRELGDAN